MGVVQVRFLQVQQRVDLLNELGAHGTGGDFSRDRVELDSLGTLVDLSVYFDAGLAFERLLKEGLACNEYFVFHSLAVLGNQVGLGRGLLDDGGLHLSNQNCATVKAEVGHHDF